MVRVAKACSSRLKRLGCAYRGSTTQHAKYIHSFKLVYSWVFYFSMAGARVIPSRQVLKSWCHIWAQVFVVHHLSPSIVSVSKPSPWLPNTKNLPSISGHPKKKRDALSCRPYQDTSLSAPLRESQSPSHQSHLPPLLPCPPPQQQPPPRSPSSSPSPAPVSQWRPKTPESTP